MGELHLDIIVDRMKREFNVEANIGQPQVAYRETITQAAECEGKYIKQSGGRGQYAKHVMVVGGGNTAMDAVRTAKRLGAERAIVVYRRSEEEMPARVEEVRHAKEEGIEFMILHNPIEYHADEHGRVCEAVLQVMTLGEPDESGRRSPVEVEGQIVTLPVDMVIVSVGVSPNPLIPSSVDGLEISRKGTIVVNDQMQSSLPMLFAGGDIVRGGATVILAMADGRKAAKAMHEYLTK